MEIDNDAENKKTKIKFDAERLIEKGMDIHEKNWKDKFNMKHTAKKEILELKHAQKNEFKIMALEDERKDKEIERTELAKKEEAHKKFKRSQAVISALLVIIGTVLICLGNELSKSSGNPNSAWDSLMIIGVAFYVCIIFVWKIKE